MITPSDVHMEKTRTLGPLRSSVILGVMLMFTLPSSTVLAQEAPAPNPLVPAPDASIPAFGPDSLPHDLSPWGMFQAADIFVQAVMVGLAIASVVTWTVWLAKTIELLVAKRRMRQALVT